MTDNAAGTGTPTNDAGNNANAGSTPPEVPTGQPTDNAAPPTNKPAEPQVPESYDFKMPEGVEVDKAAVEDFTAVAKELKLDQATAQKVADVGAKMMQRQAEAHAKMVESWVEQVKTDPEIGGDKFDENVAVARKALETFGTPELKDVLNATGLGNHPAVLKAFYKAGKAISEDGFVPGQPKSATSADPAKRLFPNMN